MHPCSTRLLRSQLSPFLRMQALNGTYPSAFGPSVLLSREEAPFPNQPGHRCRSAVETREHFQIPRESSLRSVCESWCACLSLSGRELGSELISAHHFGIRRRHCPVGRTGSPDTTLGSPLIMDVSGKRTHSLYRSNRDRRLKDSASFRLRT